MAPASSPRIRLDRILANAGYCTRSGARDFLKIHEVTAGGVPPADVAQKIAPADLRIDSLPLEFPDGLLVMFNKPAGYICSHDSGEGPLVYDLLPEQWMARNPRPATIGRLDKDATGLLLITDITGLIHTLTSPKTHVEKSYRVTVDSPFPPNIVERFAAGTMMLSGEKKPCLPASLTIKNKTEAEVTLAEGKYHQVKRMFAACGCTVTKLHRFQFGNYELGNLTEGEWRPIDLQSTLA
jgi:16S rRNA pseudouridine516 synthase